MTVETYSRPAQWPAERETMTAPDETMTRIAEGIGLGTRGERAAVLAAADLITDKQVADGGIDGDAAGLYPSLHLNLGDCYRRLSRFDQAKDHLRRGLAALPALRDGGYAEMVREALEQLAARLEAADPTGQ
jgi:tetratricopeptide (TPR) repeat protein